MVDALCARCLRTHALLPFLRSLGQRLLVILGTVFGHKVARLAEVGLFYVALMDGGCALDAAGVGRVPVEKVCSMRRFSSERNSGAVVITGTYGRLWTGAPCAGYVTEPLVVHLHAYVFEEVIEDTYVCVRACTSVSM